MAVADQSSYKSDLFEGSVRIIICRIVCRFLVMAVVLALAVIEWAIRMVFGTGRSAPDKRPSKQVLLEAFWTQLTSTELPDCLRDVYQHRAENFELFDNLHSFHLKQEIELQDRILTLFRTRSKAVPLTENEVAARRQVNAAEDLQETLDIMSILDVQIRYRGIKQQTKLFKQPEELFGLQEVNELLAKGWKVELLELKKLCGILKRRMETDCSQEKKGWKTYDCCGGLEGVYDKVENTA